ncbi:MAG: DUF4199 domain-containing protein [Terracidiphilus sp.]|jgi:hypothetical protein
MKKTILTFGLISGAFTSIMMAVTVPFEDKIGYNHSLYLGYTLIVLSFLLVFFGIRSYRENNGNGQITFAKGFAIGISITLIMCFFYVLTWEIIYFNFMHDFMDNYAAHMIAKAKAAGATAAAIQAQIEQMKKMKQMYENPLYNAALTFIEPFPVGLVITLLSAAVLRKRAQPQATASALPASS